MGYPVKADHSAFSWAWRHYKGMSIFALFRGVRYISPVCGGFSTMRGTCKATVSRQIALCRHNARRKQATKIYAPVLRISTRNCLINIRVWNSRKLVSWCHIVSYCVISVIIFRLNNFFSPEFGETNISKWPQILIRKWYLFI